MGNNLLVFGLVAAVAGAIVAWKMGLFDKLLGGGAKPAQQDGTITTQAQWDAYVKYNRAHPPPGFKVVGTGIQPI